MSPNISKSFNCYVFSLIGSSYYSFSVPIYSHSMSLIVITGLSVLILLFNFSHKISLGGFSIKFGSEYSCTIKNEHLKNSLPLSDTIIIMTVESKISDTVSKIE